MSAPARIAPVRVAMWSGPRNISTAMMRAFESRGDTAVVDEPFYAAYLAASGIDHPMRAAVLASQSTEPARVAAALLGPLPDGAAIAYHKHITTHMLPGFPLDWLAGCRSAFLIRDPARAVASYAMKRAEVTLADLGIERQWDIFRREADRLGRAPPVIDAEDLLSNPAGMLATLCAALGISFTARMLSWPPGRRATDGVWAAHWYGAVERSTGFSAPPGDDSQRVRFTEQYEAVVVSARAIYQPLRAHRLVAQAGAAANVASARVDVL